MGEVSLASRAKRGNQGGVHRGERRAFCENDLYGVQYLEEGLSAPDYRGCRKGMMVYRLRLMKVFVLMAVCLWCWQCSAPRYPAGVPGVVGKRDRKGGCAAPVGRLVFHRKMY